jgi:hypothetical protein
LVAEGEIELKKVAAFELKKAELPDEERFKQLTLSTQSKQLIDTIKMVAYRAETAMVQMAREVMRREDDARSLLRALYCTEADLVPDEKTGTLTVRVHHQASPSADAIIRHLCNELNQTETIFPGTSLRLVYELVSNTLIDISACSCEMTCE